MLLILTPNPSLDRAVLAPGFRATDACRVTEIREAASGKGLNVLRAAQTIGLTARALGPLAGMAGQRVAALALAAGMDCRWTALDHDETRICTLALDPDRGDTLALNEPGPPLHPADVDALLALVRAELPAARALACCGSLPPGFAPETLAALLREAAQTTPVYLDTSAAPLAAALDVPLALLKVNAEELGAALGAPVHTADAALNAARAARARGPLAVVVTRGPAGALASTPDGDFRATAPPVQALSAVGSGDATMAGIAAGLLRGAGWAKALALGMACGAANTLMLGSGVLRAADVDRLLPLVMVEVA